MKKPADRKPSLLDRLRSIPLKGWVLILALETIIFLGLIVLFVVLLVG